MNWVTTSTKYLPNWKSTSSFGKVLINYTIKK